MELERAKPEDIPQDAAKHLKHHEVKKR